MTEPIVLRSVTVSEVMDGDGQVSIELAHEGDPALWDMLGLLQAGVLSVQSDMRAEWQDDE